MNKTEEQEKSEIENTPADARTAAFPIVGVGGSAGGLEAFQKLLRAIPPNLGMAYVFIMHLSPKQKSILAELLAKETKMPVSEVKNGMRLAANHVYVKPPNTKMRLSGGKLVLERLKETDSKRMPVDNFFNSLALEQGARAIGVILSGTATDGTLGAEDIKAEGGIVFAQDQQSAKYDGMPQSAINAGCVDLVLSPEKIANELIHLAKHPYILRPQQVNADESIIMEDKGFESIFDMLRRARGVDFTYYKAPTVKRRVSRQMVLLKMHKLKDYISYLRENNTELDCLYDDLLINVTRFFREPAVFDALKKQVLPAIIKDKVKNQIIKVWVPGCSSGEEVYSVAICILEALGNKAGAVPVQIFGSDISDKSINKARRGIYSRSIENDITPERLKRFFIKDGDSFKVSKQLREMCVFSRQNVFNDPPFSNLDLISCRNLLIYLQPFLQKKVFSKFHYALRPGGFLLLGSSESAGGYANLFKALDRKHKIFIKKYTPIVPMLELGREVYLPGKLEIKEKTGIAKSKEQDIENLIEQTVLLEYARCGVLIDNEMEVVQFRGHTGRYLESAAGKPSHNIFKLARQGLAMPLRAAINKAKETKRKVIKETEDAGGNGRRVRVNLTVIPVKSGALKDELFLVLFDENAAGAPHMNAQKPRGKNSTKNKSINNDEYINNIQQELTETKDYLQTIIEEHESANEEVKTANEEILSSNEELQSTNEELETAKEELQSSNEELITTNEELQTRNKEAALLNNDLINLLTSINIPVIMMDTGFVIRRVTAQAEKALNVTASDVGRPITAIKLHVEIPDLENTLADVIENLHQKTFEIQNKDGNWYSVNIRPYRTTDNRIDGVVAVFVDISQSKSLERSLRETNDYLNNLFSFANTPIIVWNPQFKIMRFNRAFEELTGRKADDVIGRSLKILFPPEMIDASMELIEKTSSGERWKTVEIKILHLDGTVRIVVWNSATLFLDDGRTHIATIAQGQDITEHKRLQEELIKTQKLESLGVLAGGIAHDFNNILTGILGNISLVRYTLNPGDHNYEILADAEKAAFRAKNLTLQLLTFSKGGMPVKKVTVISDILKETVAFATHGSKAVCKFDLPLDLQRIDVDPGQIGQVFSNIVVNAVQAMPEGGKISIKAENIVLSEQAHIPLKAGHYVHIAIKNNGAAIPVDILGKIFDPYFTTKAGSSGLGLATSYSIIKKHNGYITVSSEQGKEVCFDIYLPVFVKKSEAAVATPIKEIKKGRGRILIMDDEEIIRIMGIRSLTKLGYTVESFPDSAQTVARYRQICGTAEAFDVVILDLTIPGGAGGKETLLMLKEINPDIIAVVSSGYSVDPALAGYKDFGFSAVLPKPYEIEDISEVLYNLLMKDK